MPGGRVSPVRGFPPHKRSACPCWASQESIFLCEHCESPTQAEIGKNWYSWEKLVLDGYRLAVARTLVDRSMPIHVQLLCPERRLLGFQVRVSYPLDMARNGAILFAEQLADNQDSEKLSRLAGDPCSSFPPVLSASCGPVFVIHCSGSAKITSTEVSIRRPCVDTRERRPHPSPLPDRRPHPHPPRPD